MASGSLLKPRFGLFSDFQKKKIEIRVQNDAPGPVSPLRVRIFGVWARGAFFGLVFWRFSIFGFIDLFSIGRI